MSPNIFVCNNVSTGDKVPYCLHPKDNFVVFNVLRHVMTIFSIVCTIGSVYIVVSSKSVTRVYGKMLVFLMVIWMSMDIVIQWIGDPVLLFPLMCEYRRAPLLNVPMSAAACFALVQTIVMLGLVTYIVLFLYRHQVIVPEGSRFKLSVRAQIAFLVVLLIPYVALGVQFYTECIPAVIKHYKYLSQSFFDAAIIERVDCFPLGDFYYSILAFDGHFAWIFIVSVAVHTFRLLKKTKNMSKKTQELHRTLMRSLIAQAVTPVVFVILPVTLALVTQIIFINNYPSIMNEWGRYTQRDKATGANTICKNGSDIMPFDFVLVVISFHATAHSISVLATTPAFRTRMGEIFGIIHRPTIQAPSRHSGFGTSLTF